MNIFLHELRFYRKNTLLWILSLCAGTLLLFWMYPAFANNTVSLNEVLKNYPDFIQKGFGLSADKIGTIPGFYSFIVTFLMLCGAVQAMMLGISVLAKEATGKTADFLLTKPVTRSHVLSAKLLAVFTCIVITSAAYIATASAIATAVSNAPFDFKPFLMMSMAFFFLQVIFIALGFMLGAVIPKIRSVLPLSLSIVFGFFIIGMVAATLDQKNLYYLSPFKYFDTITILEKSTYQASFMIMGVLVTTVAVFTGYMVYTRRDIHSA